MIVTIFKVPLFTFLQYRWLLLFLRYHYLHSYNTDECYFFKNIIFHIATIQMIVTIFKVPFFLHSYNIELLFLSLLLSLSLLLLLSMS